MDTKCVESGCVHARWTSQSWLARDWFLKKFALARCAILGGHPACLACLAQRTGITDLLGLVGVASGAGQDACRQLLLARGYMESLVDWNTMILHGASAEALKACMSADRESTRRLLPDGEDGDKFSAIMVLACVIKKSPECLKLLYDYNYYSTWRAVALHAPKSLAHIAICYRSLACLRLLVANNGPLDPVLLDSCLDAAAKAGKDILKYVHCELGAELDVRATQGAARAGQVGALKYALEQGAPWQDIFKFVFDAAIFKFVFFKFVFDAAVRADSMACLRALHKFALQHGYPYRFFDDLPYAAGAANDSRPPPARSLAVLQYVQETIRGAVNEGGDCAWADQVLQSTADYLESKASETQCKPIKWQMVLYLAKNMDLRDNHPLLHEMAEKQRKRAAGLAHAFYTAGKLGEEKPSTWWSMGMVPVELRELIAFKAHLVFNNAAA